MREDARLPIAEIQIESKLKTKEGVKDFAEFCITNIEKISNAPARIVELVDNIREVRQVRNAEMLKALVAGHGAEGILSVATVAERCLKDALVHECRARLDKLGKAGVTPLVRLYIAARIKLLADSITEAERSGFQREAAHAKKTLAHLMGCTERNIRHITAGKSKKNAGR